MKTEFKAGDVFHAYWKDTNQSNHCFEGTLIAKEYKSVLRLYDTFWSPFGGNGGKDFSIEDAYELFNITFYRNLNDYDLTKPVKKPQSSYLEHDFIFLHNQHACAESCKYFYLRKGAKKSKVIMLHALNKRLDEAYREIESAKWRVEYTNGDIQRVHNGEEVYI